MKVMTMIQTASRLSHRFSLLHILASLGFSNRQNQSRQGLSRLDTHHLADSGLTRAQALAKANRPKWDAPHHWVRRS